MIMNTFTKNRYYWLLAFFALVTLLLTGCGRNISSPFTDPIVGTYKCDAKYSKTEDGTVQQGYWYFKKNGKLLYCVPQVNSVRKGYVYPGDVSHGTWKHLKNNHYQIKLHDDYVSGSYTIKASLTGDRLTIPTAKNWVKEVDSKIDMSSATYKKMFNKAKQSELTALAVESSSSAAKSAESRKNADLSTNNNGPSTNDSSQSTDPDEIGRAVYSRVFPSEEVDSVEKDGDRYYVSNEYHSADSTVPFQINGDTVTYWTQGDGDTTADGPNEAHTVSIDDLLGN